MQKKFRSITAARKFAKTTGMKVKQGKSCKLADGTKARWYTLTKKPKGRYYGKGKSYPKKVNYRKRR